ncbi:hypothetical protein VUR80DRAFT_143 [Thermomyces stellatus]
MLGWVLGRGSDAGRGAHEGDDTTQIDQPDTPAPVFAARALKSAFYGEANKTNDDPTTTTEIPNDTPTKPSGILLTPGTGTSRRKRVSFGREVLDKGPQAEEKKDSLRDKSAARKRTRLTELMESSRREKTRAATTTQQKKEQKQPTTESHQEQAEDDEWEEESDDEDVCTQDITIDLNEPHSRSGKYWKTNFETYHQDAKSQMEKLLKYKQLAKSYAKMKDAEAVSLQEKLKEEQAKVAEMEKKLSEMATQIASRKMDGDERESSDLIKDLAKQTALAVQYKSQVKELEALVKDRTGDQESKGRPRRVATSPSNSKVLLETQRELRRAKAQLRDMESLQDEVKRLKSELNAAEQRISNADDGHKRSNRDEDESSYVKELLAQLRDARAESRKKDDQMKQLADDYDKFRAEAVARQEDAKRVLEKATDKISELKSELRALKSTKGEYGTRPRSFHGTAATANEGRSASREDDKPDIHANLRDLARLTNSASPPRDPPSRQHDEKNNDVERAKSTLPSRTPRDKLLEDTVDAEVGPLPENPAPNVLTDRVNLERPKWQPYIPRSPRNRAYFMEDLGQRRAGPGVEPPNEENGPTADENKGQPEAGVDSEQEDELKIDLLRDRFKNLGLPDTNTRAITANNSRCTLPPERRAAALARIEKRKAERLNGALGTKGTGRDKENVRPGANRRTRNF